MYERWPDVQTVLIDVSLHGRSLSARLQIARREIVPFTKERIFKSFSGMIRAVVLQEVENLAGFEYRVEISVNDVKLGIITVRSPTIVPVVLMKPFYPVLAGGRFSIYLMESLIRNLKIESTESFEGDVVSCPCGDLACPYDLDGLEKEGQGRKLNRAWVFERDLDRHAFMEDKYIQISMMKMDLSDLPLELISPPVDLSRAREVSGRDVASMGGEVHVGAQELDGWTAE